MEDYFELNFFLSNFPDLVKALDVNYRLLHFVCINNYHLVKVLLVNQGRVDRILLSCLQSFGSGSERIRALFQIRYDPKERL